MNRRPRAAAVALAAAAGLLVLAAAPASAHGGSYRGPGGRSPGDPTAPTRPSSSPTTWETWWTANAWEYLNLKERLRSRDAGATSSGGGVGETAGGESGNVPVAGRDPRAVHHAEILPVLLAALEDSDSEVRSAATIALGKLGFPRSLPALLRARRDSVRDVRDGAVLGVGMLRDPLAVEPLMETLFDPAEPERTRSFAAVSLGLIGGPEAATALLDFLAPEADAERVGGIRRTAYSEASAILALGMTGFAPAVSGLRRDYASEHRYEPSVRSCVALALARLGDRESIPFLLQGLDHQREPMRQSAAIALGLLGKPGDAALLAALTQAAMADRDMNTRQFAVMALARVGGTEGIAALRRLLDRGQRTEVPFVALALGIAGDRESLPALRKLFADARNPDVQGALALSLGLLHDGESAETLRRLALAPGNRVVRGHCLTALGIMDDRASAPPVRKFLAEETDPGLRLAGAVCLGLLRDPSALGVIRDIAAAGDTVVERANACRLLGWIGDLSCARILIGFVTDANENSVVRMTATAALGTLADRSDVPLLSRVGMNGNYALFLDPIQEISSLM